MILPIIGQECIVTYRGELHMGTVTSYGPNHAGQYRIGVRGAWGYAIDFKSADVSLVEVKHGIDRVYDQTQASIMFAKKYDSAAQARMLNAETGIASAPAPPPPAPPPARNPMDPPPRPVTRRVIRR
jgi:hypothetical protein